VPTHDIGTGLDYDDVAEWEAATDVGSPAEDYIGDVDENHTEVGDVTIKGFATGTYHRELRTKSGFSSRAVLEGMDVEESDFVLEDIDVETIVGQFGTAADLRIRRVLVAGQTTRTTGIYIDNGAGWEIEACVIRDVNESGIRSWNDVTVKNCTAHNCVIGGNGFRGGFHSEGGTMTLYSNASFGHGGDPYKEGGAGTLAGDYNWGDDSGDDRPGANGGDSLTTADFEDAANDDFHIPDTDSDLYQGGDPANSAATDFDGVSFDGTNPSAGAFEFVSGGAADPAFPFHLYYQQGQI